MAFLWGWIRILHIYLGSAILIWTPDKKLLSCRQLIFPEPRSIMIMVIHLDLVLINEVFKSQGGGKLGLEGLATLNLPPICPWSHDPFYIKNYYTKWVNTSWTCSIKTWYICLEDQALSSHGCTSWFCTDQWTGTGVMQEMISYRLWKSSHYFFSFFFHFLKIVHLYFVLTNFLWRCERREIISFL